MAKKATIGSGDAGAREGRVASVMIANLPELTDRSRVLVVEDLDEDQVCERERGGACG
jgi:hypothetical protein